MQNVECQAYVLDISMSKHNAFRMLCEQNFKIYIYKYNEKISWPNRLFFWGRASYFKIELFKILQIN